MCLLQLISCDFYISFVSISLAFITIPQNIGKIKINYNMPTNPPPSLRWTVLGFGGQWFSNKASLFKMVTNIETIGIG